jgi:YD repeat-containing protein
MRRPVTATLPNGVETAYTYDDAGRLTQIEHRAAGGALLARYAYALDDVGNRVEATETISTPGQGLVTTTLTYTYDSLYRLTEADYSSGEKFEYQYDAVGNRTIYTATLTQTTVTTYSYDAGNRLVNAGGVAYTWDDLGRLANDATYTYTWDGAGRLITVTNGVTTVGFRYDGDGNRLARIVNGTLTTHTLDVGLALPEVLVVYGDENALSANSNSNSGSTSHSSRYVLTPNLGSYSILRVCRFTLEYSTLCQTICCSLWRSVANRRWCYES